MDHIAMRMTTRRVATATALMVMVTHMITLVMVVMMGMMVMMGEE